MNKYDFMMNIEGGKPYHFEKTYEAEKLDDVLGLAEQDPEFDAGFGIMGDAEATQIDFYIRPHEGGEQYSPVFLSQDEIWGLLEVLPAGNTYTPPGIAHSKLEQAAHARP